MKYKDQRALDLLTFKNLCFLSLSRRLYEPECLLKRNLPLAAGARHVNQADSE
jgi:hypothetical protein